MAENGTSSLSEWDLFPKMAPYYDRHLLFPLLNDREDSDDVRQAKYELFKDTNMIDFVAGLDQDIKGLDAPAPEWAAKREELIAKEKALSEVAQPVSDAFDNEEVLNNLRSDKEANMEFLKDFGVTAESVAGLYDLAYFLYNRGSYSEAASMLTQFRTLVSILLRDQPFGIC